jgi:hypothetical protein
MTPSTREYDQAYYEQKIADLIRRFRSYGSTNDTLKQLGVVTERSEVAVHHTRMIANQDGSVYSTRCSTAYAVHREDQWQRRSKDTELES